MDPMLRVALKQTIGNFHLDVAFDAPAGVTVLFGPSGAGKTSVVNAVAGLERHARGYVHIAGRDLLDSETSLFVAPHKRKIGYVFQDARLFPHLSVRDNLDYARKVQRARKDNAHFDRIIEMLGIGALLERRPLHLSGGEKQRVAIGRALLARPKLLLADEPLAALDGARKSEILPYFEQLRDEGEVPILYVTHSASEVARLASQVVALAAGSVVRQGTATEVLSDPSFTPGDKSEIGAVIEARVTAHHDDGLSTLDAGGIALHLPRVGCNIGDTIRIRIAAQDVMLATSKPNGISALNCMPGHVQNVHMRPGPAAVLSVDTKAGRVLARVTKRSVATLNLSVGSKVVAVVKTISVAAYDVGGPKG